MTNYVGSKIASQILNLPIWRVQRIAESLDAVMISDRLAYPHDKLTQLAGEDPDWLKQLRRRCHQGRTNPAAVRKMTCDGDPLSSDAR
jgi:hypothetical protein